MDDMTVKGDMHSKIKKFRNENIEMFSTQTVGFFRCLFSRNKMDLNFFEKNEL